MKYSHPTAAEIRNAQKARAAAGRAYVKACRAYDETPDRCDVEKQLALFEMQKAKVAYDVAKEAMGEITRRCNRYASQFAPKAK
jgi:hypothetical protein